MPTLLSSALLLSALPPSETRLLTLRLSAQLLLEAPPRLPRPEAWPS